MLGGLGLVFSSFIDHCHLIAVSIKLYLKLRSILKPELSPWWHVLPIHHGKSVNWHLEYRAYFLYLEKCLSPKNHIFYIFLVTWNSSSHFLFLKSRCLIDCRLQYQCDIISSFGEKRHISKEEVFQWAILCWNLSLAILLNYIILAMWKMGFMKHSPYTALSRQKDQLDIAPLCLFQQNHLHSPPTKPFTYSCPVYVWTFFMLNLKLQHLWCCNFIYIIKQQWEKKRASICKWYRKDTRELCQLGPFVLVGQYRCAMCI